MLDVDIASDLVNFVLVLRGWGRPLLPGRWLQRLLLCALGGLAGWWGEECRLGVCLLTERRILVGWFVWFLCWLVVETRSWAECMVWLGLWAWGFGLSSCHLGLPSCVEVALNVREGPVDCEYVKGISTYLYKHSLSDLGEGILSLVQPK
jgi:hypothetical protein